jgi:hypothetical protein
MPLPKGYTRVTRSRPCPICQRPDYCLVSTDGLYAGCTRTQIGCDVKDGRPWMVAITEPTWRFTLNGQAPQKATALKATQVVHINAAAVHEQLRASVSLKQVEMLSASLGVTVESLHALEVGWSEGLKAFSFPMRDEAMKVIGVRLRRESGFKFAVEGSRNGLFVPGGRVSPSCVMIVEGPTDTAAAHDWGFNVVGRPNASACVKMIVAAVRGHDFIILANHDQPKTRPDGTTFYPGQEGATKLADALVTAGCGGKVIYPTGGHKDARAWRQSGASQGRVNAVIRNARYWTVRESA